ncbi:MAG: hypothetical protein AN481_03815 [Aphanizomenon flos-aquae LD13]|jgi:hypothetical protein|uniref:DUF4276 domain-containing protein n=1 Tax=Aphanizomenon flos-aquae LD13 TaxID=1710894 RepID=A0A1B7W0D4_APHFL|nr:DUF4276 family protein [Aphanizomenon flos-aquae UKL13-PB]MBO1060480.1 DUF4276 family protein [Aphanizomenon flos-aquae CP01]OBQ26693.1 MAG: hypothetical protein AN481_03815 [Aphanizomenon flos-aquae LD13]HCQ20777.1 hypothetical protein [Anabaena sp. UBA12330]
MNEENNNSQSCYFFEFGLFVTGETEEDHLPSLLKNLINIGICKVIVKERIPQLSPITSKKRLVKIAGSNNKITTKEEDKIVFPARKYLSENPCRYLLLIDDLENDRASQSQQVFERYRNALDTCLSQEQKNRASVHFLANMIEAYYFADSHAINKALGTSLEDHSEDVEKIPHPKNELKKIYPGFDEKEDGGKILKLLRVEHILARPHTCAYLRTLFYWCYQVLQKHPDSEILEPFQAEQYHFRGGILSEVTRKQLDNMAENPTA